MALQNSYRSFSKWRLLLTVISIFCCLAAGAQEAPVSDTVRSPEYTVEDVQIDEEEEDETDAGAISSTPAEPELRQVPDSVVKRYKADPDFVYANDPGYWQEPEKKKDNASKPRKEREERDISMFDFSGFFGIVKILFIAILIALLAFLVYKLMGNRWPWQQPARLKEDEQALAEEELNEDELQQKIRESINQQKFRMAIRYSYLFTLRRMDEKGWIRLDAKSTNHDYVNQMKAHDPQGTFAYLTNIYDYVWYGEFELNEDQFGSVYKDFQNFLNTYSH